MTDPDAIRDAIDALRATGQDSTADMLEALSAKLVGREAQLEAVQRAHVIRVEACIAEEDRAEAAEARVAELDAERTKDHAEINTKADFIEKTISQLAENDQTIAGLEAENARLRKLFAMAVTALMDGTVTNLSGDSTFCFNGEYHTTRWLAEQFAALKGDRHEP